MRLKALLPDAGCRLLAANFNRRFERARGASVSKSYVAALLRRRAYEVQVLRRRIKNQRPRAVPRNLAWGVDLTMSSDSSGAKHHIFAVIDHGSRALLALEAVADKSRKTLLASLLQCFRRFGRPRIVRTDNERIFSGVAFPLVLLMLGIRHRPTEPGCPWQNGRVERLFGTLKAKLRKVEIDNRGQLALALVQFRFWYNHVRPHQNLEELTSAERWAGLERPPRERVPYGGTRVPVRSLGV